MGAYAWCGNGCPPSARLALCKAFIAKSVWDFATTSDLIDAIMHRPALRRLCGWETHGEVPSESTFSRSFAAFVGGELAQRLHAALLKIHYGGKLAGHISRDSTAIHAREEAAWKSGSTPQRRAATGNAAPWSGSTHICTKSTGGRHVRVRGPAKVAAHLAFGLLVIAAEQILGLIL